MVLGSCVLAGSVPSGIELSNSGPLQSVSHAANVPWVRKRDPVLRTSIDGNRMPKQSLFRPMPSGATGRTQCHALCPEHAPEIGVVASVHECMVVLSDAERSLGEGSRPRSSDATHFVPRLKRRSCLVLASFTALSAHRVPCGADVAKECYLVDPASSHMLVSKIKPCMCKYELIQTVKLRMAH